MPWKFTYPSRIFNGFTWNNIVENQFVAIAFQQNRHGNNKLEFINTAITTPTPTTKTEKWKSVNCPIHINGIQTEMEHTNTNRDVEKERHTNIFTTSIMIVFRVLVNSKYKVSIYHFDDIVVTKKKKIVRDRQRESCMWNEKQFMLILYDKNNGKTYGLIRWNKIQTSGVCAVFVCMCVYGASEYHLANLKGIPPSLRIEMIPNHFILTLCLTFSYLSTTAQFRLLFTFSSLWNFVCTYARMLFFRWRWCALFVALFSIFHFRFSFIVFR